MKKIGSNEQIRKKTVFLSEEKLRQKNIIGTQDDIKSFLNPQKRELMNDKEDFTLAPGENSFNSRKTELKRLNITGNMEDRWKGVVQKNKRKNDIIKNFSKNTKTSSENEDVESNATDDFQNGIKNTKDKLIEAKNFHNREKEKKYKKTNYRGFDWKKKSKQTIEKTNKKVAQEATKAAANAKAAGTGAKTASSAASGAGAGVGAGTVLMAVILVLIAFIVCADAITTIFVPVSGIVPGETSTTAADEQTPKEFLAEQIPLMKEEYVSELEQRITELQNDGYNHIFLNNVSGNSIVVTDVTNPDCGLLSDEYYIEKIEPIFIPLLMGRYGFDYSRNDAINTLKDCFDVISLETEVPLNDTDGNGVGNYCYCDGYVTPTDANDGHFCIAFYNTASGLVSPHGRSICYNCSVSLSYHTSASGEPCCHEECHCNGHTQADGSVTYCNPGCVSDFSCSGYRSCYGHKEIMIVVGTGDYDLLMDEYFLDRINELEGKSTLTEDEQTELMNLKNYYEMALNLLENGVPE